MEAQRLCLRRLIFAKIDVSITREKERKEEMKTLTFILVYSCFRLQILSKSPFSINVLRNGRLLVNFCALHYAQFS